MTEVGSLKAIEVLLLLAAGGLFVWWQMRDLRRAREDSRAKEEAAKTTRCEPPP